MKALTRSFVVALCLIAAVPAFAAEDGGASETEDAIADKLREVEAIVGEARRQEMISRRMADLVVEFQGLVSILRSNGLLDEGRAEELVRLSGSLGTVRATNVDPAVALLQEASQNEQARREKLEAAEAEIQSALREMTTLLRQANAIRFEEFIVARLTDVVREQERVTDESQQLGKQLLQGETDLVRRPEDLAGEQRHVARNVGDIHQLIKEAATDETTETSFRKLNTASSLLEGYRIEDRLAVVARNIDEGNVVSAVADQQEVLAALRKLLKVLKSDKEEALDNLYNARNILERALEDQIRLRDQVQATAADQFESRARRYQAEQHDIRSQTSRADALLDAVRPKGELAHEKIAEALAQLEQDQKDLREKTEQAAPEDRPALAQQQKELRQRARQMALEMTDEMTQRLTEQASEAMGEALDHLDDDDVEAATAGQQRAEEALRAAREQAEALAGTQKDQQVAMAEAGDAMNNAEAHLQKNEQQPSADEQTRSEQALRKALRTVEAEIVQKEFGKISHEDAKEIAALRELVENIRSLQHEQGTLRGRTEDEASRERSVRPMAPPQQKLSDRTGDTKDNVRQDNPVRDPLQAAKNAMDQASEHLQQDQSENAIDKQLEAEDKLAEAFNMADMMKEQKEADAKLDNMLADLERLAAKLGEIIKQQRKLNEETQQAAAREQDLKPQAGTQREVLSQLRLIEPSGLSMSDTTAVLKLLAVAKTAMKTAADELDLNRSAPGMLHQRRALAALEGTQQQLQKGLEKLQKEKEGRGKREKPGDKKKKKGKGKKDEKGKKRKPSDESPPPPESKYQNTRFGPPAEAGESNWQALKARERDALSENFARELPREYRDMLKAYYERLLSVEVPQE